MSNKLLKKNFVQKIKFFFSNLCQLKYNFHLYLTKITPKKNLSIYTYNQGLFVYLLIVPQRGNIRIAKKQIFFGKVSIRLCLDYIFGKLQPSNTKSDHRILISGLEPGIDRIFHYISQALCEYATIRVVLKSKSCLVGKKS